MPRDGGLIYDERVTSKRTVLFFLALATILLLLFVWRATGSGIDILAVVLLCLSVVFFFYSVNYRTLIIRLTAASLQLKFGIFGWEVPLGNIEECRLDDLPLLMRMGGAGIHFMSIRGRYRASFNFLEHPRVVIALRRKVGLVQDVSFSTRRPDDVLRFVGEAISMHNRMDQPQ